MRIAICLVFVLIAISTYEPKAKFLFWSVSIFFGSGVLLQLAELLSPKNLFVTPKSKLAMEISEYQAKELASEWGSFDYCETGFNLRPTGNSYLWDDISTVFAFKEDRWTTDEICLDIVMNDGSLLKFEESMAGFHWFTDQLSEKLIINQIGMTLYYNHPSQQI